MSAITDYFAKLQRENYKNPKRDNRAAMMIFLSVVMVAAVAAAHH